MAPIPDELHSQIAARCGRRGVVQLPEPAATGVCRTIASAFGIDPSRVWWWEGAPGARVLSRYADADGLQAMAAAWDSEEPLFLVVTDDSPAPWPVWRGSIGAIVASLAEVPWCEYFVCSVDLDRLVFDTHRNELVVLRRSAEA